MIPTWYFHRTVPRYLPTYIQCFGLFRAQILKEKRNNFFLFTSFTSMCESKCTSSNNSLDKGKGKTAVKLLGDEKLFIESSISFAGSGSNPDLERKHCPYFKRLIICCYYGCFSF